MMVMNFKEDHHVWEGIRVVGYLMHDNGDTAAVYIDGRKYLAAVDEQGVWRFHIDSGDNPKLLRGPYTYEQIIAIMRLLS